MNPQTPAPNVLRISPPMVVSAAEVDEAIGKLDASHAAIGA
jgi:4-aminobutyrate aminotransferase-like enzyme